MPPVDNVSLSPYSADFAEIERKRALAQALQQQSMQPIEQSSVNGIPVPISPFQGLAKLLQGYNAGTMQKSAIEQQRALYDRQQADRSADLSTFAKALAGTPGTPEQFGGSQGGPNADLSGMDSTYTPAVPGRRAGVIDPAVVSQLKDPQLQAMALAMLPPKAPIKLGEGETLVDPQTFQPVAAGGQKSFNLGPGQTRFGPDGKPIVSLPEAPVVMSPGQVRVGPDGKPIMSVPDRPDDLTKALTAAGIDVSSPEAVALFRARAAKIATHPPASSQTLINAGPKAFETELGKLDAEQLGEFRKGAQSAQQTLGIVQNLRGAVNQGVFSGGGAQAKTAVSNMIEGITGAKPKNLVGSQLFNAEASKLVLERIKTLGANPSNADREFIEKTVPNLSTSPEARDALINFLEEKAKWSIDLYQRADRFARQNHGLGGFELFPAPPATTPPRPQPGGGRVRTYNPQTGRIE